MNPSFVFFKLLKAGIPVAGAILDLDGDRAGVLGSSVATWLDVSGNENNAVQADSSKQPIVVTGVNGHNAVAPDGINDLMTLTTPIDANGDFTIFVIQRRLTTGTECWNLSNTISTNAPFGPVEYSDENTYFANVPYVIQYRTHLTSWNIWSAKSASSVPTIWRNGGSQGVSETVTDNLRTTFDCIFARPALSDYGSGPIARIILYPFALIDSDRKLVENYLSTLYGIAIQPDGLPVAGSILDLNGDLAGSIGTSVSTWLDDSGWANDVTQVTVSKRPVVVAGINGHNAVQFDGVDDYLSSGMTRTFTCTIFVVYTRTGGTNDYLIDGGSVNEQVVSAYMDSLRSYGGPDAGGTVIDAPATNTDWNVGCAVFNTFMGSLVSVNGIVTAGFSGTNQPTGTTIGCAADQSGGFLAGSIARLVVFPTALSSSDRILVENYLGAIYGIAMHSAPTYDLPIAGAVLDLNGDNAGAIGDSVATWVDASGNGNNASQLTGSKRPIVASGLNGHNSVTFDGVDDILICPAFSSPLATSTIFCVCTKTATTPGIYQDPVDAVSADPHRITIAFSPTDNLVMYGGNTTTVGGVVPSGPHVLSATFGGTTWNGSIDGVTQAGLAGNAGNNSYGQAQVGADPFGNTFHGPIARVIIYPTALSDSDRQTIEDYLGSLYGITITH